MPLRGTISAPAQTLRHLRSRRRAARTVRHEGTWPYSQHLTITRQPARPAGGGHHPPGPCGSPASPAVDVTRQSATGRADRRLVRGKGLRPRSPPGVWTARTPSARGSSHHVRLSPPGSRTLVTGGDPREASR
jgi:hypothetical protein